MILMYIYYIYPYLTNVDKYNTIKNIIRNGGVKV